MSGAGLRERFTWALARLNAWRKDSNLYTYYREAKEREQWTPGQLADYGNARLRETIRYAYETVPYYRRRLDERGVRPEDVRTVGDLPKLPVLTRGDVKEHYEELRSTPTPSHIIAGTSSGSTGEPVKFLATRDAHAWHSAARLRAWEWAGYRLGDRIATLWACRWELDRLKSLQGWLRTTLNHELMLESFDLSDHVCKQHVDRLRRFKPKGVYGIANAVHFLARYCLDHGVDDLRLDFVFCTSETLLAHQRALVEGLFGCKVYDRYSAREVGMIADQCSRTDGYHIATDNCAVEIVNEDGTPVRPGEEGLVLVTDYCNRAMPFIRYRVGDVAVASPDPCPCGRPFPLLRQMLGREKGFVQLRDGRSISTLLLCRFVRQGPDQNDGSEDGVVANIRRFQVIQESYDDFRVLLSVRTPRGLADYAYIERNFREMISRDINVNLEFVDRIPQLSSGKCPPVISRLD